MVWVILIAILKMMLHLANGMIIDQRAILRRLADLQYTRNDQAFQRGTFRVRGEVIDIFPAESDDYAYVLNYLMKRLSVYRYLILSPGQIHYNVPRFTVYPKTHYVTPRERILMRWKKSNRELAERRRCYSQ